MGVYEAAIELIVRPQVTSFRPDLVFVCCGVDGSVLDPLAQMRLHSHGYYRLMTSVLKLADYSAGGRVVASYEGGYSAAYSWRCGLAIIDAMAGVTAPAVDPFIDRWHLKADDKLNPLESAEISNLAADLALQPK